MKIKPTFLFILLLALAACRPSAAEQPAPAAETAPTAVPDPTIAPDPTSRFTIQADEAVRGAVMAVYTTLFPDEQPDFVAAAADLLVTAGAAENAAYFLPGVALVAQTASADAADFITFAISPDGQQALIDIGALPASVTVTDQAGNTVAVPQPVRRVISAHGPTTFLVYGVGAGDRLVAASYLGARDPAGAAAMARMDPRFEEIKGDDAFAQRSFNVETAATLAPDLILGAARSEWLGTTAELGVPTILFEAETPERLQEAIRLSGQLFGPHAAAQAEAWIAYYEAILNTVREETAAVPADQRVRVLFTGSDPLQAASGEMYQTSLIEAAGGESVSVDLPGYWNDVNLEQIAVWNPDVIVIPPYGGATIAAITDSPEWQVLDAVQNGRVYQMPKLVAPWDTPAPDSVLGIVWLAERLHPGVVSLSCAAETRIFYNIFYGYDITAEEIAALCGSE
ncbi:MAG: ABC transporter substrate-binding protein [Chloroflexi bacterium]|nr:ABC transporter substrate-binding protein [Chloroflexota bacterium]